MQCLINNHNQAESRVHVVVDASLCIGLSGGLHSLH